MNGRRARSTTHCKRPTDGRTRLATRWLLHPFPALDSRYTALYIACCLASIHPYANARAYAAYACTRSQTNRRNDRSTDAGRPSSVDPGGHARARTCTCMQWTRTGRQPPGRRHPGAGGVAATQRTVLRSLASSIRRCDSRSTVILI